MRPPVFRTAAAADVEEAYHWYEGQGVGLGDEFLASVQAALEAILLHPLAAPLVPRLDGERKMQPEDCILGGPALRCNQEVADAY